MPGMGFGFGFGFHRRASGSGAAAFTPESLFAASEAGAWYDPSDLSTLWQDTGGTVPVTADGQNVARMDDKSGNGNHVTQATSSLRPVYKTNGTLHWLLADGVDDLLRREVSDWTAALSQPGTAAVAAQWNTLTGNIHIFDGRATSARWTIYRNTTDLRYFSGTEQTVGTADTNRHVYLAQFNGASSFFRQDGVQLSTANPGAHNLTGLYVLSRGGADVIDGPFYGLILTDDTLSAEEISNTETYLANKSGVTL